ncbi:MAG: hypothetical protein HQL56_01205 [Magnetococcales bacterium]|nr:hypothetical protein [Magnetococcales bacterium]
MENLPAKANIINITMEQGADRVIVLTWYHTAKASANKVDLTGATASMQIRTTVEDATPLLTLDTGVNGGIALGGAAATITVTITDTQTAAMDFDDAVYDLVVTLSDGSKHRVAKGVITLDKGVTR